MTIHTCNEDVLMTYPTSYDKEIETTYNEHNSDSDSENDVNTNMLRYPEGPLNDLLNLNQYVSSNTPTSILFNIDDSYKILYNIKNCSKKEYDYIIKYHNIIYGNDIIPKDIIFHPSINKLYPKFLNECNFFINDNCDIDNVCMKISSLSKALSSSDDFFNTSNIETINPDRNPHNFVWTMDKPKDNSMPFFNSILRNCPKTHKRELFGFNINSKFTLQLEDNYNLIDSNDHYVLFNKNFLKTHFVKSDSINTQNLTSYFPELNLLTTVNLTDDMIEKYQSACKNIIDEREVLNKIKLLQKKKTNEFFTDSVSFDSIKLYLETTYKITSNIEDKIQFNTIYTHILKTETMKDEDASKLYKLLPIVLKELGLSKKRYSTGVFWYGLILKEKESDIFLAMKYPGSYIEHSTLYKYEKMMESRGTTKINICEDENAVENRQKQWNEYNATKTKQCNDKHLLYKN